MTTELQNETISKGKSAETKFKAGDPLEVLSEDYLGEHGIIADIFDYVFRIMVGVLWAISVAVSIAIIMRQSKQLC